MSGFMAAGQARADVDWLVNISDAGFEGTPAGGTVSYSISVSNNGFDLSSATTITLDVPAGTTFTGASGTITGCAPTPATGPATVVCNVPPLRTAEIATLVADIKTTVSGSVSLRASVPTAGDSDTGNNEATEPTTILAGADISLTLTGPATASSGAIIPYNFSATNNGPDPARNVVLQFPVPAGIANVTAPAGCTLAGTTYSCTIAGPIPSGGSVGVGFTGQISAASGSTIAAVGSVSGATPADPNSSNNGATLNTAVTSGSDLVIGKARSPGGPLLVGDAATFTLSPRYTGDSPNSITVTDTIPANYTIGTITAPGWTCTVSGQLVRCTRASGTGAGANVSLGNITIATTAASAGSPTNAATIAAAGPADPNSGNNTANDGGATITAPQIDLQANKTGPDPRLVVEGNSYNFSISTSNVGNANFFGTIEMTDSLPAGLTVTSYGLNGWTCTPAVPVAGAQPIVCSRVYTSAAPLTAGATTPVVTLTATVTSPGTIANALHVGSPDGNLPDNNSSNDDVTYAVTGSNSDGAADISVVKTAALASLPAGEVQTFDIEVTNSGPAPAANVSMTDDLTNLINTSVGPTGSGYISESITPNSASGVSCNTVSSGSNSRFLSCFITSLPVCTAGSTCPVITVTVRPGGNAGARTNTANVLSNTTADANLGNNGGSASYNIEARADVTVSKSASPNPAVVGQNLTYVIAAQNLANGLSSADAVTITDTLPSDVTFVSASPSSGACATKPTAGSTTGPGNNSIVCNLGTISNGAQQTVTVVVRPKLITRSTTLRNDVAVTTTTTETNTGNNAAFTLTPVNGPVVDLVINKDDTVDPLAVGDDTVYLVTVTNLGPSAAENVVVTDSMPPSRVAYRSHVVPSDGSCSTVPAVDSLGGTLVCTFPLLNAGESRVIQVTGRGVAKGTGTNDVSVSSDDTTLGFEPNTSNNTATENTSVRTRVDVAVTSKVATPGTVNLRDPFTFLITVQNNTGTGLAEADDTLVTDTLPAGMELTGTPTFVATTGTTTGTTCTGAAGATSFTCGLGTFSNGGVVEITVPVRIVTLSSNGQNFTNSATISTSSIEPITSNNVNSGPVTVNASSIAGTVFRDFADDAAVNGSDTGISGVTMTLTGTAFDGTTITRTTTTDGSGNYTFGLLPEGNYNIAQGAISETYLANGTTTAGTSSGTVAPTAITAIPLGAATNATGYLFPKVPQARVSIAKAVQTAPAFNPDGSFNATFRLSVRNLSLEGLTNVEVTDSLAGAAPLFGTYTATTPTLPGTYTMAAPPSGSCGGLNAGFTGAADTIVATAFTLATGATCTIDLQLRVMASNPLPPLLPGGNRYLNQAGVDATGAQSGQTSATNPQLADLSDSGTNTDANGNGQGNEAGENDPTPLPLTLTPSIRLEKRLVGVTDTNGDGVRNAGDTASYSFTVTNTGPAALANVVVTDPLVTMSGSAVSLPIGASDSTTFSATYLITQADVDRGYVDNTATVNGDAVASDGSPLQDDSGNPIRVTDISDTGTAPDGTAVGAPATTETPDGAGGTDADPTNDPTSLLLARAPRIDLVKRLSSVVDTTGDGQIGAGDTANYAFAVTNTGNVALAGVTVTDPLVTVSGGPVALAIGATDAASFTAAYVLTQADVDRGYVQNTATTTGSAVTGSGTPILDGSGNPVTTSDTSDTGTNPDGSPVPTPATTETPDGSGGTDADPTNDPTVAVIVPAPRVVLEKRLASVADTNADGLRNAGDTATYGFTVTNTGTMALIDVTVTDPLVTMAGGPIALLPVGASDTTTFSATYVITQADVDLGHFDNTASVTGDAATAAGIPVLDAGGNPISVTDISDTGTAPDGTAVAAPATTETPDGAGGTDADPTNDPTSLLLGPAPQIDLVKRLSSVVDTTGDGQIGVGDTANYTFAVTNTGNVALAGVTVTDPLVTVSGGPVALAIGASDSTSFTAAYTLVQADVDRGYVQNTATTTGSAVTGSGTPILDGSGNPVTTSDTSDTGTNPDGTPVPTPATTETPDGSGGTDADPTNDPTVAVIVPAPRVVLEKRLVSVADTNGDGVRNAGDTAAYGFTVTNTGTMALIDVTVTDPLVTMAGGPIALLPVGASDTTTFSATYVITQADVDLGHFDNTASVTGDAATAAGIPVLDAGGNPISVTDISDTGTAPDGTAVAAPATTETPDGAGGTDADPTNDPTSLLLAPEAHIQLVKRLAGSTDVNANGFLDLGDVLNYAFDVTNSGNVALAGVTVNDPLVAVTGGPINLAVGETNSTAFTAAYTLVQADVDRAYVQNTATTTGAAVTGSGAPILDGSGNPVTTNDTSDTGTNPDGSPVTNPEVTETPDGVGATDGDPTNDPTVVPVGRPEIQLDIEIADIIDTNGNGIIDAGDDVVYTFTVTNTGDVPLSNVNMDYTSLSLPLNGLVCTPISLAVGETQTLVCTGNTYTITPADVTVGTVALTGTATGASSAGVVVSDDDAVVSPTFGLGGLTITKVVDRGQVNPGDVVTYTITVTSTSTTQTTVTNVVDVLPAGFVYQSGTATVAGAAVEPAINGRTLSWAGVSLAPGASTAVVLEVLVSASAAPGNHDNVARAVSPLTGLPVTADAIATVRIAADPVFACSTVIGRVFDDLNQDGYYNGEPKEDRAAITDQSYRAEKWSAPEEPQREKGLPGVRLVAPNGLAITTDEHGRFSVPCAALPADIGSNFMLKLDTRTLPSGYRLTTENPRLVRVTPGMLTKMNFGATISRVVRVDLSDRAFGTGDNSTKPRAELVEGLKAMVAKIADTPAVLRLSYQLGQGESEKLARQRMREVERILRNLWPANGRYQLNVETVIQHRTAKAVNE